MKYIRVEAFGSRTRIREGALARWPPPYIRPTVIHTVVGEQGLAVGLQGAINTLKTVLLAFAK